VKGEGGGAFFVGAGIGGGAGERRKGERFVPGGGQGLQRASVDRRRGKVQAAAGGTRGGGGQLADGGRAALRSLLLHPARCDADDARGLPLGRPEPGLESVPLRLRFGMGHRGDVRGDFLLGFAERERFGRGEVRLRLLAPLSVLRLLSQPVILPLLAGDGVEHLDTAAHDRAPGRRVDPVDALRFDGVVVPRGLVHPRPVERSLVDELLKVEGFCLLILPDGFPGADIGRRRALRGRVALAGDHAAEAVLGAGRVLVARPGDLRQALDSVEGEIVSLFLPFEVDLTFVSQLLQRLIVVRLQNVERRLPFELGRVAVGHEAVQRLVIDLEGRIDELRRLNVLLHVPEVGDAGVDHVDQALGPPGPVRLALQVVSLGQLGGRRKARVQGSAATVAGDAPRDRVELVGRVSLLQPLRKEVPVRLPRLKEALLLLRFLRLVLLIRNQPGVSQCPY
jgi:hypothetical protein